MDFTLGSGFSGSGTRILKFGNIIILQLYVGFDFDIQEMQNTVLTITDKSCVPDRSRGSLVAVNTSPATFMWGYMTVGGEFKIGSLNKISVNTGNLQGFLVYKVK